MSDHNMNHKVQQQTMMLTLSPPMTAHQTVALPVPMRVSPRSEKQVMMGRLFLLRGLALDRWFEVTANMHVSLLNIKSTHTSTIENPAPAPMTSTRPPLAPMTMMIPHSTHQEINEALLAA